MKVAFRLNASKSEGMGHLVRCLALADAISEQGGHCTFLLHQMDEHVQRVFGDSAHKVRTLKMAPDHSWQSDAEHTRRAIDEKVDWLVCDHYGLDNRWECALRDLCHGILVIDDLADRPHACNVLVDPGFSRTAHDYERWLDHPCKLLLGTQYAILRTTYADLHDTAPVWPKASHIHLFFGGGDHAAWLPIYAEVLLTEHPWLKIHAVGQSDPSTMTHLVEQFKQRLQWSPYLDDMARSYAQCDLAIGAPGTATWERACVGLPSALIATHPNQVAILKALDDKGFCYYVGEAKKTDPKDFIQCFSEFIGDVEGLRKMRALGVGTVDGRGSQRILDTLLAMRP